MRMNSDIRVLEVGPGNFGKGGISVIAWRWYSRFDLEHIAADFASAITPEKKYTDIIRANGGEFYCIASVKNKMIKQFEKAYNLRKIAKKNRYDCIHIHSDTAYSMALFYYSVSKYCDNIILHAHSSGIDGNSSKKSFSMNIKSLMHTLCRPLLAGKNVTYLACSELSAKWLFPAEIYKNRRFTVIANGIETEKFIFDPDIRNEVRKELSVSEKFVIGNVGRFAYPKNHDFLIDVFEKVCKKNSSAVLLLVGNGELEEELKNKVSSLGLDKAVIFFGTTPDVHRLYQAMDCFVFPSRFEGLGMAAIEAQASGLRTVCADTIPAEANITELFEYMPLSASPEEWADKILSCSDGYERKDMSDEINRNGYNISQSAKQIEELYFNLKNKEPICPFP